MATIINNPPGSNSPQPQNDSSGVGLVVGILVLILLVILFFVYVRPIMTRTTGTPAVPNTGGQPPQQGQGTNINVQLPGNPLPSSTH